ncbi:MAG TPA: NUDIX domain-containing protein [Cyclobacteriaceae bacterium]|nr:NUDIX domain-containing protein [Cyclobacteriaceae bacterium]
MIIFINDIPVRILKESEEPDLSQVNNIIDATADPITKAKLIHHVMVKNVEDGDLDTVLDYLNSNVPTNLLSLHLAVKNYDFTKAYLRSKFKIVKAAGGLVRKKDKFLMIYRMKKWDLPKGKKERGEKYRDTALREIEEECNITVKIGKKICTTWHTYTMNKNAMLKKTRWYLMDVEDDSKLKPSVEEDIEEARWMSPKEVYHALEYSYQSISFVFEQYYALKAMKSPPQSW